LNTLQEGPAALLFKGGALADSNPFILTSTVAMCAVIARNYQLVKDPDQHRRIKWVIYGSIVGIVPGLLNTILQLVVTLAGSFNDSTGKLLNLSNTIVNFMTVAIPLSIGYAVLKHRAFDINVVIRRGLQHLFAKQALRVILALPLAGLLYTVIANRNLPLVAILTGNPLLLLLIAAAGLSLKFRRQLIHWIDRRFFREAYSQEQILLNVIEKIKTLDSMPELSRLVSKEVESALHPGAFMFSTEVMKNAISRWAIPPAGDPRTCGSPKTQSCFNGCAVSAAHRNFLRPLTTACLRSLPPGSGSSM
jgi:hypothetical protein